RERRPEVRRLYETGPFLADEEVAEVDRHVRQCRDCPQIGVLAARSPGVDATGDVRGVVVDRLDLAVRRQGRGTHGGDVQPLVRGALERPIVEVEAVDIDDRARHEWDPGQAKGRPDFRPRRPLNLRHAAGGLRPITYTDWQEDSRKGSYHDSRTDRRWCRSRADLGGPAGHLTSGSRVDRHPCLSLRTHGESRLRVVQLLRVTFLSAGHGEAWPS